MKVKAKTGVHDRTVDESENRSLSAGKIYWVIGLNSMHYRIIDDAGEPFIYSKELFEVIDSSIGVDSMKTILME